MQATPIGGESLIDIIDRQTARDRERLELERRLRGELMVLEAYDNNRRAIGHDYGCGQRANEINRRTAALTDLRRSLEGKPLGADPTPAELFTYLNKLIGPRVRRAATMPSADGGRRVHMAAAAAARELGIEATR